MRSEESNEFAQSVIALLNKNLDQFDKAGEIQSHSFMDNSLKGEAIAITNIAFLPKSSRMTTALKLSKVWVFEKECSMKICVGFLSATRVKAVMDIAAKRRRFPIEELEGKMYEFENVEECYKDVVAFLTKDQAPTDGHKEPCAAFFG